MPISLKAATGGGSDPINSLKDFYLDDILHTTVSGQKWLRTGWVETNIGLYPDAKKTTIPLDMSTSGITYSGSANIAQVDSFVGGGLMESYFTVSSDKTRAGIPCGTTANDLNSLVLYTTNGGSTWATGSLTAETTHNYNMGAIGTTKNLFVGFGVSSPSVDNSKYVKTNTSFTSPTASVNLTIPNVRLVCFTGTNFIMMSNVGKLARVPDATDSITYMPDAPTTSPEILMSPSAGVALYTDFSGGRARIYRSTDEGGSWTNVLDLNNPSVSPKKVNGIYVDGSKLYAVITGSFTATSNHTVQIYTSINGGVTWVDTPYTFTWDGVSYSSSTGWPITIAPATYSTATSLNPLFKDTSTTFRLPLRFNDTKMSYLQSLDNGVTWTMLKPATRTIWSAFIDKMGIAGKLWYTAELTNGVFAVVNDLQSPLVDPIYKFQGSSTFVGVPEVYTTTGLSGSVSVGTSVSSSKYVRIL